jgi:hypothetical protein
LDEETKMNSSVRCPIALGAALATAGTLLLASTPASAAACYDPLWSSSKGSTISTSAGFCSDDPTETGIRLVFQTDGNLVYYKGSSAIWSSRTNGSGHTLRLQTNGDITVYGCSIGSCVGGDHLLWHSNTAVSGTGWTFSLGISLKPETNIDYVLEDEVDSGGGNHFHYIGAGASR